MGTGIETNMRLRILRPVFCEWISLNERLGKEWAGVNDVRRCKPDGRTRRLAMLFGRPYLRPCRQSEMESRIEWLLAQSRRVDHDGLAWVFPKLRKLPTGSNWVSSGSIVWIKEVRR